jgi:hypothetical protein
MTTDKLEINGNYFRDRDRSAPVQLPLTGWGDILGANHGCGIDKAP